MPRFNEDNRRPRDRKKTLLRLWKYLAQHKWMILAAFALVTVSNLLALIGPKLSGNAIDAIGTGPGEADFPTVFASPSPTNSHPNLAY